MSTQPQKLQIVTTSPYIEFDDVVKRPSKPIAVNSIKLLASEKKCDFVSFLMDDFGSTIPIFMKYFAAHETIVLICGGLYLLQPDIGVVCLSVLPGLSIIGIFTHFLLTQFHKPKVYSTFFSLKHYLLAFIIFILGLFSIYVIYHTNTYLSTLVPLQLLPESTATEIMIGKILNFPGLHSVIKSDESTHPKPFNYRVSFVGSIIAPIIEESFKYLLLALTFPIAFLWSFSKSKSTNTNHYSEYCIQSLFVMFVALCGACGIAVMENMGYLAACQWQSTRQYCLPNKNFDIGGAGLARGIFSVPFHCVTACIMADIVCTWMHTPFLRGNTFVHILKFILSYPLSIVIPVLFHSNFNYWMRGMPFMTGLFTVMGYCLLGSRMMKKYAVINADSEKMCVHSESTDIIDVTVCEPEPDHLL